MLKGGLMSKKQEIIYHLKAKSRGNGSFVSLCPIHDDTNPSLSITFKEGLINPLMYCHAGCSQKNLIQYMIDNNLWVTRTTVISKTTNNKRNNK